MADMKEKEPRLSVRVDSELKQRVERVARATGVDEATLVRNCIEALCAHVERAGQLVFPIQVGPATEETAGSDAAKLARKLAGGKSVTRPPKKPSGANPK